MVTILLSESEKQGETIDMSEIVPVLDSSRSR